MMMPSAQRFWTCKSDFHPSNDSGFKFSLYRGSVDWKKIDDLDIDRLIRDQDLELLASNINNVVNYSLQNDLSCNMKILDSNFIKLFRLAQLTVDYLLYCKSHFENCIVELEKKVSRLNQELDGVRKDCHDKKLTIKSLKRKLKENEAMDRKYQNFFYRQQNHLLSNNRHIGEQSAEFGGLTFSKKNRSAGVASNNNVECQCEVCGKLFINRLYLYSHHVRRHLDQLTKDNETIGGHPNDTNHQDSIRLEIKQLKERLNVAESKLRLSSTVTPACVNYDNDYANKFQNKEPMDESNAKSIRSFPVVVPSPLLESGEIPQENLIMNDVNVVRRINNADINSCESKIVRNGNYKDDVESLRNMLQTEIKKLKESGKVIVKSFDLPVDKDDIRSSSNTSATEIGSSVSNKKCINPEASSKTNINYINTEINEPDGDRRDLNHVMVAVKKDVSVNTVIDQVRFQKMVTNISRNDFCDPVEESIEQSSNSIVAVLKSQSASDNEPVIGDTVSSSSSKQNLPSSSVEKEVGDDANDNSNSKDKGMESCSVERENSAVCQPEDSEEIQDACKDEMEKGKVINNSSSSNSNNNNNVIETKSKLHLLYSTGRITSRNRNYNHLVKMTRMTSRTIVSESVPDRSEKEFQSDVCNKEQLLDNKVDNESDQLEINSVSSVEDVVLPNNLKNQDCDTDKTASVSRDEQLTRSRVAVDNSSETVVPAKRKLFVGGMIVENSTSTDSSRSLKSVTKPEVRKRNLIPQKSVWSDDIDDYNKNRVINVGEISGTSVDDVYNSDGSNKNTQFQTPVILITEHKDGNNVTSSSSPAVSDFNVKKNKKFNFNSLISECKANKISSNNSSTSDVSLESLNSTGDMIITKRSNDVENDDFLNDFRDGLNTNFSYSDDNFRKNNTEESENGSSKRNQVETIHDVKSLNESAVNNDLVLSSTSSASSSPKSSVEIKTQGNSSADVKGNTPVNYFGVNEEGKSSGDVIMVSGTEINTSLSTETDTDDGGDSIRNVTDENEVESHTRPTVEQLLASNPEIFDSLRKDLEEILNRRLRDLGVDPEWTTLPNKTFENKMNVLKHHMKVTSKSYKSYYELQKQIEEELDRHYCKKYGLNDYKKTHKLQPPQQYDKDSSDDYEDEQLDQSFYHGDSLLSLTSDITNEEDNVHKNDNNSTKSLRVYQESSPLMVKEKSRSVPITRIASTSSSTSENKRNTGSISPAMNAATTSRSSRTLRVSSPLMMADIESDTDEETGATVLTMYNKYKGGNQNLSTGDETESVTNTSQTSSSDYSHRMSNIDQASNVIENSAFSTPDVKTGSVYYKGVLKTSASSSSKKKKRVLFLDEALVTAN